MNNMVDCATSKVLIIIGQISIVDIFVVKYYISYYRKQFYKCEGNNVYSGPTGVK